MSLAAVRQEATGIDQIVTAMDDINKVTTQFVSATEQTKASVESLGEITITLDHRYVADFFGTINLFAGNVSRVNAETMEVQCGEINTTVKALSSDRRVTRLPTMPLAMTSG